MYKMEINVSGQQRIFLFRGPGCRKAMLEWWRDHLHRAEAGEDFCSIRVLGTVGNKTDIVLEWPQARARPQLQKARSQQRSTPPPHEPEFPRVGPRRAAGPSARLDPEAEERRSAGTCSHC
jgi:hypothetical protein